jgi:pyruvate/2-oxoglutarate dehydrogenase complex dihydrolipoamide acyltransferase (E2) component
MSTVKELMLSPDGTVAEPLAAPDDEVAADADVDAGADDDEDDEDDEQPAATTAAAAATATRPATRRRLPPPPLLPSCIPYPFRRNAVEYSDYSVVGQRTTRVSLRDER